MIAVRQWFKAIAISVVFGALVAGTGGCGRTYDKAALENPKFDTPPRIAPGATPAPGSGGAPSNTNF